MKKIVLILTVLCATIGLQAQNKETPNAQQARRIFNETFKMIYGEQGSQLHYKVNIIGIYKTEGTIWTKGKKSKFVDEKYIAWNDDVTYYRLERKKNRVVIYDATLMSATSMPRSLSSILTTTLTASKTLKRATTSH